MDTDKNLNFSNDSSQPIDKVEIMEVADLGTNIPAAPLNAGNNSNLEQATLSEPKQHNIQNFMGRRYPIGNTTITWTLAQGVGANLATIRLPDAILSKLAFSAKVRGFKGFKFSFTIEAEVTTQPMQTGQLLLAFCHNAKYNAFKVSQFGQSVRVQSGAMSQKLNVCDGHKFSLTSKYTHPFIYYDLINGDGTLGDVYLTVVSPLNDAAASGTAPIKLFAYFYDIELEMPVGNAPALLAAGTFEQALKLVQEFNMTPSRLTFEKLRALRIQSNDVMSTSVIKQKALPNMATSHSSSYPHVLALSDISDSLNATHGNITRNDMSFSNILSRQCYYGAFPWTGTNASESIIYSQLVTPNAFTANASGVIEADYIQMLGEKTTFWSGSIEYEFDILSTQFHHGRLRFAWAPGATIADITNPAFDHFALKSIEIDIAELAETKGSSTHSVSLPCTWPQVTPQLLTSNATGVFYVMVIQPLTHPDTVPDTINITVWRKGMSDLRFKLPKAMNLAPINTLTPVRVVVPSTTTTTTPRYEPEEESGTIEEEEDISNEIHSRGRDRDANSDPNVEFVDKLPANLRSYYYRSHPNWTAEYMQTMIDLDLKGGLPHSLVNQPIDVLKDELRKRRSIAFVSNKHQLSLHSDNTFIQTSNDETTKSTDIDNRALTTVGLDTCGGSDVTDIHDFIGRSTVYSDFSPNIGNRLSSANGFINVTSPPDLNLPGTWVVGRTYRLKATLRLTVTAGTVISANGATVTLVNATPTLSTRLTVTPTVPQCQYEFDVVFTVTALPPAFAFTSVSLSSGVTMNFEVTLDVLQVGTNNPIAIQPYIFNVSGSTIDDLSYWASIFTYARGGVDLKLLTNDVNYSLIRDPTHVLPAPSSSNKFELSSGQFTNNEKRSLSTCIQQFVSPSVEGFGEVRIPYDAKSSAMSINNRNNVSYTDTNNLTAINAKFYINPYDLLSQCVITRSATPEFKFFILNGPSFLHSNT
jgi:hypothetical protein